MSMHAIADGHLALPARTTRIADASSRRQRSCAQMASSAQLSARAQLRAGFALRQRAAVSGKAHQRTGRAARGTVRVTAMLPAEAGSSALEKGKAMYAKGDRMEALKVFEEELKKDSLPNDVRLELLYSSACCHAAFGDIDSAWQNLRDSMLYGLDYNDLEQYPSFMKMEASPQLRKQLSKFAAGQIKSSGTVAREKFQESRAANPVSSRAYSDAMPVLKDLDLDSSTDDSFGAIAKRVLLLLTFAAVSGVVLFNVGLSTFKGT